MKFLKKLWQLTECMNDCHTMEYKGDVLVQNWRHTVDVDGYIPYHVYECKHCGERDKRFFCNPKARAMIKLEQERIKSLMPAYERKVDEEYKKLKILSSKVESTSEVKDES